MITQHEPPLECVCIGQFSGSDDLIEAVDGEICQSPNKTPLLSMQIIIREATSYKARALNNRAVVFGHSHARIIKDAQQHLHDPPLKLHCRVIEMIGRYLPFSTFENGTEVYNPDFLFDLESAIAEQRPSLLIALMSGLEIMITVRAFSIKPFDVLMDSSDLPHPIMSPPTPGLELLPASTVYLDYQELMRPWIRALPVLGRRFGLPVIMLCPPPPISDNEAYIRFMPEEIRLEMQRSMPPSGMRYRIWVIWWRAVRDLCSEYGIPFLPPPAETIDPKDGGLASTYYGDGLHANDHFGAAQIRMVEAFLAGDFVTPETITSQKPVGDFKNPYSSLSNENFWRPSISNRPMSNVDPVIKSKFVITPKDKIATAGSCFAQHIARHLKNSGFTYYVSENHHPVVPQAIADRMGYGVFTARYGNIYTARQWRQLLERAYGSFDPVDGVWQHKGGFVDAFRPRIEIKPFTTEFEVRHMREPHFKAVREAVENADYFIFTLGLTECWVSKLDGAVYPLCPGVAGGTFDENIYEFHNFTVSEVVTDLQAAYAILRANNPNIRIILTVSPVPLVATYEPRSVLTSTICSKSILRAAADEIERAHPQNIAYFPSYEIITGPHAGNFYFEADRREVTEAGVAHVMRLFMRHYTTRDIKIDPLPSSQPQTTNMEIIKKQSAVICDEEVMDQARSALGELPH
ncbi:MAG TPA: GSCFA domain-containing protein [Acidocella sp.]|nr:GSCFA domain-containing protein [Acidocella sp.]